MSLLDNFTKANLGTPYYGGGGGGGGGNVFSTVTSTLAVENITPLPGKTQVIFDAVEVDMANSYVYVSSLATANPGNLIDMGAGLAWNAGGGSLVGVSSINGAAYAPVITGRFGATSANIYVPAAGTNQTVGSFSTVAGHVYQIEIDSLRIQNQPPGPPAAGAWSAIYVDANTATYLDTFDMASVSTIANDLQKSAVYTFRASAAGHNLIAQGLTTNTISTAMTFPGQMTLRDLGALSGMPVVG